MRKTIILAALAALALGACGKTTAVKDPDTGKPAANALNVKAHEYMFDVTGEVKTGFVTIDVTNTGKELHHAIVTKLGEGKTLEDLKAYIQKGEDGPPPEWLDDSPADMNLLGQGESASVTFEAKDPGTYTLLCFIPGADGAPHVAKGMMAGFEVTEGSGGTAPKADAVVEMTEYKFSELHPKAGEVTLEFKNAGKEEHDFALVSFAEGKGLKDVDPWFQGGLKDPAPAKFFGGTHTIEPGKSMFFTADLKAGTYSLVCTVTTDDGKEHADDLGMVLNFEVA